MRLHVEVDGPQDGVPVVFLHGVSGSSRTYDWLPEDLRDGRRIVKLDLRGHGASEHAPGTYDVDRYGEDVAEVLRTQVGRPALVVGHSLGGVVAWWLAQQHPELVAAAFLEDPPLYMGEPAEHEQNIAIPIFRIVLDSVARWRAEGASEDEVAAELAAAPGGADSCDDVHPAFAYALLAMDPGVLEQAADASTLAVTDTASPVSVPLFLLAADEALSAFPSRHAERLAQTHPAVEVVRVSGAPHGIHNSRAHRAAYVEQLARFLDAHGG